MFRFVLLASLLVTSGCAYSAQTLRTTALEDASPLAKGEIAIRPGGSVQADGSPDYDGTLRVDYGFGEIDLSVEGGIGVATTRANSEEMKKTLRGRIGGKYGLAEHFALSFGIGATDSWRGTKGVVDVGFHFRSGRRDSIISFVAGAQVGLGYHFRSGDTYDYTEFQFSFSPDAPRNPTFQMKMSGMSIYVQGGFGIRLSLANVDWYLGGGPVLSYGMVDVTHEDVGSSEGHIGLGLYAGTGLAIRFGGGDGMAASDRDGGP